MDFLEKAYNYNFEGITNEVYQFRFISTGIQEITKIVSISPVDKSHNWYNVGFGNLENNDGSVRVNDLAEINNNDYDEVLATVFMCILHFFNSNRDCTILFFGNTLHKHRLYKQKISSNISSLEQYLDISGGKIEEEITIIEKKQTITRKGKEHERTIREKDLTSLQKDIVVKQIEKYNKDKTADYQFVLFKLKNDQ
ncbi:hypothetical protein NJT12_14645 [Flavobacterium sp. AC]|uniref:Uncharacterized protein n=1 Tax=Flavobacterium azizsancarii TaxID=2961580 RepID=A0ABT4WFI0_9FLAO|nr:hypothetical protein [Flavobacterium azizsancarii]MDA6070854.1 hypothetical protein [Flavobacterium azizsancarii]